MKFYRDPLSEKKFTKIKGIVYKYSGRVLVEMNNICPKVCEFCTRKDFISEKKWKLSQKEAEGILSFLKSNLEIEEVVISGGDPLMSVEELIYLLKKISEIRNIRIIRIHTRMPITAPDKIDEKLFPFIKDFGRIIYMSIHCNLAEEINDKSEEVINKFRKAGVILYSQSVSLRGINDSVEKLEKLFKKLLEIGVRPYYIYRCDPAKGNRRFIVPFEKERKIMTELRKRISGLACPTYVIDAPRGLGKIPVTLNFWKNKKSFIDFNSKVIDIDG